MKIAFFVPNSNISKVDFTSVDRGNPGVGGSEYSAILVASALSKKGSLDVTLLCEKPSLFPDCLKWKVCGSLVGAIKTVKKFDIDYLVVDAKLLTKDIVCRFSSVKFIAWANTFIPTYYYEFYARHDNVVKIVNVGKEELEQTKGTPVYGKSCYIYNAVPTAVKEEYKDVLLPNKDRPKKVCYIGSLHPAKGFQYLAKAWPSVIKRVPDAQLYVIGSGKLYGRGAKLGAWGIADSSFEKEFMPYIVENGKIIDSVHFLGILGKEKYDVLSNCKVGVPNPSGVSETFGYTAVEMEFMDCQVTTIKCAGYLDTVCDKTNLYSNTGELADYIVRLLKNDSYDNKVVLEYIKQFSVENIAEDWEQFFFELNNKEINTIRNIEHYKYVLSFYMKQAKKAIKYILKIILKKS